MRTITFRGCLAGVFLLAGGCGSMEGQRSTLTDEPRSLIASVGFSGIVTFDRGTSTPGGADEGLEDPATSPREVSIPITIVQSLPKTTLASMTGPGGSTSSVRLQTSITANVYGTTPPGRGDYYLRRSSVLRDGDDDALSYYDAGRDACLDLGAQTLRPDESCVKTHVIELVLDRGYVRRLSTHDQLRIQIQVSDVYYDATVLGNLTEKRDAVRNALATFRVQVFDEYEKFRMQPRPPTTTTGREDRGFDYADVEWLIGRKMRPRWWPSGVSWEEALLPVTTAETQYAAQRLVSPDLRTRSTTAVRTLTLVRAEDYRSRRLERSVPIYEMTAFPLSSTQVQYLFGDKVDRNFYVIGVSMQNSSSEDRLVNTGMIRVSGQALVRPTGESAGWFSVPVQVAPQSREHVYAILDDEEVEEPRAVAFRALEFVGTLATAIAAGFDGSEATIKGLGIFTGIAIPEGKKFWADRMPGYKRNVVNYVMPNLVKVGRGTSSPPYFLFFSKTQLQGMVLDSQLFQQERVLGGLRESRLNSAPVNVASLSFDAMDVPFEIAMPESPMSSEPRVAAAMSQGFREEAAAAAAELAAANTELARLRAVEGARAEIARAAGSIATSLRDAAVAASTIAASQPDQAASAELALLKSALDEAAAAADLLKDCSSFVLSRRLSELLKKLDEVKALAARVRSRAEAAVASDAAAAAKSNLEAVKSLERRILERQNDADSARASLRAAESEADDLAPLREAAESRRRDAEQWQIRARTSLDAFVRSLVPAKETPVAKPQETPPK